MPGRGRLRSRKNAKRVNHVCLTPEAMEAKLVHGEAFPLEPAQSSSDGNPAVQALPPVEKEIWELLCAGYSQRAVCLRLQLREDQCSRSVGEIRRKIHYLAAVKEIMLGNERAFTAFMGPDVCRFCRRNQPRKRRRQDPENQLYLEFGE